MSNNIPPADDPLRDLRDALRASPNNIPLRQHLANSLIGSGRFSEAEKEFRDALALAPHNQNLKMGLARAFHQQGKHREALVIVEDLVAGPNPPARAFVMHAKLLAGVGEVEQ